MTLRHELQQTEGKTSDYLGMVREFHEKFGYSVNRHLSEFSESSEIGVVGHTLCQTAKHLVENGGRNDLLKLRAHLMLEELGEALEALGRKDEVALLDGLGDLLYVVWGTAVSLGLPLEEAFVEIHKKNMLKDRQEGRPGHPGKAENYLPPDLESILQAYKERREG